MQEDITNQSRDEHEMQMSENPNQSIKLFQNPVCEQTFVALPRIYGNKRSTKKLAKQDQRLYRPCCESEHSHKAHTPTLQQLIAKHIKPLLPRSRRFGTTNNNISVDHGLRHTESKSQERSSKYSTTKRSNVLNQPLSTMRQPSVDSRSIKNSRVMLEKIDIGGRMLKESETSHKIIRRSALPIKIQNESETQISLKKIIEYQKAAEAESKELQKKTHQQASQFEEDLADFNRSFDRQTDYSRRITKHYTTNQFQIEEQDQNEEDQTIQKPNKKNKKRKDVAIQMTETREIGTQFENPRLNKTQISHSPDANTYFVELKRKEPLAVLRQSHCKSIKSSTTVDKYSIPTKEEIPNYISTYKNMSSSFNLNEVVKSTLFRIVPYKNALYIGEFQNEQRNGKGVFITEKSHFEGQFKNGLKIKGIESTSEGIYKGTYLNGFREGHGEFRWFTNEVYIGEWKKGLKHGQGTWKSSNGDYYNGHWFENRQEGYGIHLHQGSVYKGEFKNFLKHGKGQEKFINGDIYTGQFSQGRCNGQGEYAWANGMIYIGEFVNGMKHGKGSMSDAESIYQGFFQNDHKEGKGEIINKDGSKIKGTFHKGELVEGILTRPDGFETVI